MTIVGLQSCPIVLTLIDSKLLIADGLQKITTCFDLSLRWPIELFFKWIKQHLRIQAFYGRNQNAVKAQIWIAVSVYELVAIVKKRLGIAWSLTTILQILSVSIFQKTPLVKLFLQSGYKNIEPQVLTSCYDTSNLGTRLVGLIQSKKNRALRQSARSEFAHARQPAAGPTNFLSNVPELPRHRW